MAIPPHFTIDIELTNRCNADCYFCPRAATPDQGLISEETFTRALERAVEFRDASAAVGRDVRISLCGLGEPLLHRHAPDYVRRVREAGFFCSLSSNGSLLDETKARALLDAGLQRIDLNVGEHGDDYEAVYKLPFERTRQNVLRFAELAQGRCEVTIVLVNHRDDAEHIEGMMRYWRELGLDEFFPFPLINRGGSLVVERMRFEESPEVHAARQLFEDRGAVPECQWPFVSQFVGFDGQYYLCCSDWEKRVPVGNVVDHSLLDVAGDKLDYARERGPVCRACSVDPVNLVAARLKDGQDPGDPAFVALVSSLEGDAVEVRGVMERLVPGLADRPRPAGQKLIPVRSV